MSQVTIYHGETGVVSFNTVNDSDEDNEFFIEWLSRAEGTKDVLTVSADNGKVHLVRDKVSAISVA